MLLCGGQCCDGHSSVLALILECYPQGEGDEAAGVDPGDIIIEVKEVEHEHYKRKNADLVRDSHICHYLYQSMYCLTRHSQEKRQKGRTLRQA